MANKTPGQLSSMYTGETADWDVDHTNLDFDQSLDQAHVVEIANNMLDAIELCGYGVGDFWTLTLKINNSTQIGSGPMWFSYLGPSTTLIAAIKQVGINVYHWEPIELSHNMIRCVCHFEA